MNQTRPAVLGALAVVFVVSVATLVLAVVAREAALFAVAAGTAAVGLALTPALRRR